MEKLFLIAEIAATPVAICCDHIESVVRVNEVVNVPRADPVIAGLFSMRSRVLTLIDCQYRISGTQKPFERGCPAVIASINGHSFGLIVDRVRDVVSVSDDAVLAATRLDPKWSGLCSRLAEIEDHLVMILDPEKLVSTDQRAAA
jgi:purine-binding chemotaxis protein CheW